MSKKIEFRPKDFGKFHQKRRLEMIIRECRPCGMETAFVYMGKEGLKNHYQCLRCKNTITSYRKLK